MLLLQACLGSNRNPKALEKVQKRAVHMCETRHLKGTAAENGLLNSKRDIKTVKTETLCLGVKYID